MDDRDLIERLRKLEAQHLGVAETAGRGRRRQAVATLRAQLAEAWTREPDDSFSVSLSDPWQQAIFLALARRYGLRPHRHARQRRSTVVVTAPVSFYERVLWPEFVVLSGALGAWFDLLTSRVLREVLDDDSVQIGTRGHDDDHET